MAGRRFFSCRAQGVAEQILRVRRGRPPSAPAFSCSKGLSAGWGLPGEGTAGWEPSRPLWLALLKICQILQCKKKKRRKVGKKWGCAFSQRLVGSEIPGVPQGWDCRKGHRCPLSHPSSGSRGDESPPYTISMAGGGKPPSRGLSSSDVHPPGTNTVRIQGCAGKRLQQGGLLNKHQLFAMKRSLPSTQKHLLGNSRLGEAGISAGIRDRSVWTLTGHGSRHLRLPSLVTPSSSSSPFCNRNKKECERTGRASPPLSPLVPIKCNGMAPTTHFQTLTAEQIGEIGEMAGPPHQAGGERHVTELRAEGAAPEMPLKVAGGSWLQNCSLLELRGSPALPQTESLLQTWAARGRKHPHTPLKKVCGCGVLSNKMCFNWQRTRATK